MVFLLAAGTLLGQVTVETVFEHEQYLANERMRVGVRITNFSGQTLRLGASPDWLDLLVETENGGLVSQRSAPPIVEPFEVPSSSRATRWVDLIPHYEVGHVGQYRVTPTVRLAELGQTVTGKPASVQVTGGARIWEQDFGVRLDSGDGAFEVRRYALIQAMNQKKVTLYVRVCDQQEARVFNVIPIGPVLAFSRPEAQVDHSGLLHILSQTSARQFTYCVISPNGELTLRQAHRYTNSRPALRATEDGSVTVRGGIRYIAASDVPPPAKESVEPSATPPSATPPAPVEKKPDSNAKENTKKKPKPKK